MITFPSVGPWYSTEEAAELMHLTPGHVSRLCREPEFKAVKVGKSYLLSEEVVRQRKYKEMNPDELAHHYRLKDHLRVERNKYDLKILGILAPGDPASMVYARALQKACSFVGFKLTLVEFDLKVIAKRIEQANNDPSIHGIFVFYPIFKDHRDRVLKDKIVPHKDIEGLSEFWREKLFKNERYVDNKKAVLPCTSLAVLKTLVYVDHLEENTGLPFEGKRVSIFNRSDVVGLPLAHMLKNDGAKVFSFDINGGIAMEREKKDVAISRREALEQSDIIITGVPSRAFEKIRGEEIKTNATCLNFSFVQNFEESAKEKSGVYVPRVGPMTIAMCLKNAVRLYENYKDQYAIISKRRLIEWETIGKRIYVDAA